MESWLEANTYKAGETWYDDVRLAVYAVPALAADAPATPLDARFGPSIHLDGYTLLTGDLAPGDILQLALFWRAVEPVERYKVFVHLYAQDGRMAAQTDREPGAMKAFSELVEKYPDDPLANLHYESLQQGHYGTTLVMTSK